VTAPAGLVARFPDPDALTRAIGRLREAGYARIEAYTPFPIAEVNEALGERGGQVPWIAGLSAAGGAIIMLAVQWWAGAAYPLDIGGRHALNWVAFVPTTLIAGLLWMALGTFAGFLRLTGLPRLHHPIFEAAGFDRLGEGRFYLMVAADDPRFEAHATAALLRALGGLGVEGVAP
jgi:hypothetical protein